MLLALVFASNDSHSSTKSPELSTRHLIDVQLVDPESDECQLIDDSHLQIIVNKNPNCINLKTEIKKKGDQTSAEEYLVVHGSLATSSFASFQPSKEVFILTDQNYLENGLMVQEFKFFRPGAGMASMSNGGVIPFKLEIEAIGDSNQIFLPELTSGENPKTYTEIKFNSIYEGQCNMKNPKTSSCVRKIINLEIKKRVQK